MRPEGKNPRRGASPWLALVLAAASLAVAGCRQNMHNQNKAKPYRASSVFPNGASVRPLPAHTVARGDLRADRAYYTGNGPDGQPVQQIPFPADRAFLERGRERYNIFCSPCHDRLGTGRGMIVRRGYKQPPSFHEERLVSSAVGYFFNVSTEGFGVMPSYASQVPVEDRWAIAAYIRVLQLSQNARLGDLPEASRQAILSELQNPAVPENSAHTAREGAH